MKPYVEKWFRCGSKEAMNILKKRGWIRDNSWQKLKIENPRVKRIPHTKLYALYGKLKVF